MLKALRKELITLFLSFIVLALIGLNSGKFYTRVDLTEHNIYTVSEVTRSLLNRLPETAEITYYVSPELRRIHNAPRRIEELLEEYEAYGDKNLRVHTVNPAEAGVTETIEELGVEPRQIQTVQEHEERYTRVYSGIVVRYLDRSRVIPFILEPEALEYEIASALSRIRDSEPRRITLLSGHENRSVEQDYRLLHRTLKEHFTVNTFKGKEPFPDTTDVVVLLGGSDLDAEVLRRVEEYLLGGGSLLVLAEGVRVNTREMLEAQPVTDSPFHSMMAHYGLRWGAELVLDEYNTEFRVPHSTGEGTAWESLGGYPYWISVRDPSVASDHPITARFTGLDLLWAAPLRLAPPQGVRAVELLHSSTRAWTRGEDFMLNPNRELPSAPASQKNGEPYLLAAALEGSFTPYFSATAENDTELEGGDGAEQGAQGTEAEEAGTARIVAVGDSDFASDLLRYSGSAYNLDLLLNAAEWLANDEELMQLRTRGSRDLRLNALDPPRERAQYRFSQIVNLLLVPGAVLLFALLRHRRRRRVSREGSREGSR